VENINIMNTKKIVIAIFTICFFFSNCISKEVRQQRIALQEQEDIKGLLNPIPASFSHADSARLINNWKIGMRFYKANCSKCHGIFGNGKDSVPKFTEVQYDDYKTSFLMGDSTNHAVMAKMTETELNAVYLFLTGLKPKEEVLKYINK